MQSPFSADTDRDAAGGNPSVQGVPSSKAADFSQSRPMSPMPSGLGSRRVSHDGSVSSGGGGGSRRGTDEAAPRPVIHPMPPKPLSLLRQLTGHIKVGVASCLDACCNTFLLCTGA